MPNIDSQSLESMLSVYQRFPDYCLPMLGLHPTSVDGNFLSTIETLFSGFEKGNFVAVGETGIDLYWDKSYLKEQQESLELHIQQALKMDLPLVLHARESLHVLFDVLDMYAGKGLKGVFHCFPGTVDQAHRVVDMGFMLGIGGVVTYKKSPMADVVSHIGLEHIVLETDAPYLPPVPYRGKRNESSYIAYVARHVAELTREDPETVAAVTTRNADRLFSLNLDT